MALSDNSIINKSDESKILYHHSHIMNVKSIGIDTYRENIIFMHADCHVCTSEGFSALTRLLVKSKGLQIIATLNVVYSDLLKPEEAGLSMEAMKRLQVKDGDAIDIFHLKPIESLSKVRAKIHGKDLNDSDFSEIITDIVAGHYSNIELAAFITACAADHLNVNEIIGLTRAMISSAKSMDWGKKMIFDKHCVGGLPGNRTTPIIVSIVAAAGLVIPKTSSRAITSPAGTADTIETVTTVDLSLEEIKRIVEKTGGCLAWGGAVQLSPADDIIISVEKSLDVDSVGQMVASVLSKKVAAGSSHVLIDIPVGETAKIRSQEEALKIEYYFKAVSEKIGLQIEIAITDGSQPVGKGIGPALEAMDVLAVLRNEASAPADLKDKSARLAGILLELSGGFMKGTGYTSALRILESGAALKKFMEICEAQGGFREPKKAKFKYEVSSERSGTVKSIDNRKLARIAKLAGAPKSPSAGLEFNSPIGKKVNVGDVLYTIYTESEGQLEYVKDYVNNIIDVIKIE